MSDVQSQEPRIIMESSSRLCGDLCLAGHLCFQGTLVGQVRVAGTLEVAAGATIRGHVAADHVIVSGEVEGDIEASRMIDLQRGSRVRGDLLAPELAVQPGAKLDGRMRVGIAAATEVRPVPGQPIAAPQVATVAATDAEPIELAVIEDAEESPACLADRVTGFVEQPDRTPEQPGEQADLPEAERLAATTAEPSALARPVDQMLRRLGQQARTVPHAA